MLKTSFLLTLLFATAAVVLGDPRNIVPSDCTVEFAKCRQVPRNLAAKRGPKVCLNVNYNDGTDETGQILLTTHDNRTCISEGSFESDESILVRVSSQECPTRSLENIEVY